MSRFPVIEEPALSEATTGEGLVVLDFWQASCAPCRAMEPRLERYADDHPDTFAGYRIDVDTQPEIVKRYGVMSIPTLIVLKDGQETARLDGLIREAGLTEALNGN